MGDDQCRLIQSLDDVCHRECFPEPVTPSRIWHWLPSRKPLTRASIAWGWSPVGWYSECNLKAAPLFVQLSWASSEADCECPWLFINAFFPFQWPWKKFVYRPKICKAEYSLCWSILELLHFYEWKSLKPIFWNTATPDNISYQQERTFTYFHLIR